MKDMWLAEIDDSASEVIDIGNLDAEEHRKAVEHIMKSYKRTSGQISSRLDLLPSSYFYGQVLILKDEVHEKIDGNYCFTKVTDESVFIIFQGSESDVTFWKLSEPLVKEATHIRNMNDVEDLLK